MINIPRLTATKPEEQIKELRHALVMVIKQANLEISVLNRKLEGVKKSGG